MKLLKCCLIIQTLQLSLKGGICANIRGLASFDPNLESFTNDRDSNVVSTSTRSVVASNIHHRSLLSQNTARKLEVLYNNCEAGVNCCKGGNMACEEIGFGASVTVSSGACYAPGHGKICYRVGYESGISLVIPPGTCGVGERGASGVCDYMMGGNKGGTFMMESGSCMGYTACKQTGGCLTSRHDQRICEEAEQTPGELFRYVKIGKNACTGSGACIHTGSIAYDEGQIERGEFTGNAVAIIGDDSCKGAGGCVLAGRNGYFEVGKGSCLRHGCDSAGSNGKAQIGDGSCTGDMSCDSIGYRFGSEAQVGNNSCLGVKACQILQGFKHLIIGSGSCQCDHCCLCLSRLSQEQRELTIKIPDGMCNEWGESNIHCCSSSNRVNYGFDFNSTSTLTLPNFYDTNSNGSGNDDSGSGNDDSGSGNDDSGSGNDDSGSGNDDSGSGNDDSGSGNDDSGSGNSDSDGSGNDDSGSGNSGNDDSGSGNGNNGSDGNTDYSLPVYNISVPTCSAEESGAGTVVNITCNYNVAIPSGLNENGIASDIRGYNQCSADDNGVDNTKATSLTSELTGDDNENYQVVIQVTPDDSQSTAEIEFCLHTELKDDEGKVMKFHSQLVGIVVDYTTDFAVNVTSSQFDGFNETAADLGTVEFEVRAYRCDINKDELGSAENPPARLTIDQALYVCIEAVTDGIVVRRINKFTLKKEGEVGYDAVEDGEGDFNSFVKDQDSEIVQVGTRPKADLFDGTKFLITGLAELGSAGSESRYLARFTQELGEGEATTSDFEMEVEVVNAVSAADTIATGNFITFYGAMIGTFVINFFV